MGEESSPVPILIAIGIGLILLLSAVAVAFSAGPRRGFMDGFMDDWDMDIDMDFQHGDEIEVRDVKTSTRYDLTGLRREADVEITLHADRPDASEMHVSLSAEPCASPTAHRAAADRETLRVEGNGTWIERVRLAGAMPPGPASVRIEIEIHNLGPGSASVTCRDLPRA